MRRRIGAGRKLPLFRPSLEPLEARQLLSVDASLPHVPFVSSDVSAEIPCAWSATSLFGDKAGVWLRGEGEDTAPGRLVVTITSIQEQGDCQLITYESVAAESTARVSLYYAVDENSSSGLNIASELPGSNGSHSYSWDTTAVPEGDYFVFAVIEDGVNEPQIAYARAWSAFDIPAEAFRAWHGTMRIVTGLATRARRR